MTKNHYDTLKLAWDAPAAMVEAAYRYLSQTQHSDGSGANGSTHHAAAAINAAYDVLSDVSKRRAYDALLKRPSVDASAPLSRHPSGTKAEDDGLGPSRHHVPPTLGDFRTWPSSPVFLWIACIVLGVALIALVLGLSTPSQGTVSAQGPTPYDPGTMGPVIRGAPSTSHEVAEGGPVKLVPYSGPVIPSTFDVAAARAAGYTDLDIAGYLANARGADSVVVPGLHAGYARPRMDPHGDPWPAAASYLRTSTKESHANGYSSIAIDNSGNNADVYVGLTHGVGKRPSRLREAFIPARGRFTMYTLAAGHYDLRFFSLDTGHKARTEAFDLSESRLPDSVQYSTMRMTLYKVLNGNAQTYDLTDDEF
jgi:hypothetical protein